MSNDEAKFILGAYRPAGQDAGDAKLTEAVQRTRDDPELGAWFARSRAYDAAVSEKIHELRPPATLRDALLAGARASAARPPWWKRPGAWAAAASVAMLLGVATIWRATIDPSGAPGGALAEFAIEDLGGSGHRGHQMATGTLKAWLTTAGSKLTVGQTLDFSQLQASGCRTLRLGGREIVEVCFEREGIVFHFYAVPRERASGRMGEAAPVFVAGSGRAAAVWSDSRFDYALATSSGVEALKHVL